ncbi:ribonuclease TUDOR 1-like isoform X1 [Cicer arietinum]|uniref:ribonuclease TUDOR 1-like isoform X1 n=1 Tax=Cicer arietinum TaxID=3827 RepID=UPI00032A6942
MRKLLIGKEITFRIDYTVPSINREFGTVFLGDKNVAMLVVSQGRAKVREQGQQKGEVSPFLAELLRLEEQAKQEGLGRWSKLQRCTLQGRKSVKTRVLSQPNLRKKLHRLCLT